MLSCFSCVWLFATLWTVIHQAPLSMGFSRQEYWRGMPFPPLGDLPNPGIKPTISYISCIGKNLTSKSLIHFLKDTGKIRAKFNWEFGFPSVTVVLNNNYIKISDSSYHLPIVYHRLDTMLNPYINLLLFITVQVTMYIPTSFSVAIPCHIMLTVVSKFSHVQAVLSPPITASHFYAQWLPVANLWLPVTNYIWGLCAHNTFPYLLHGQEHFEVSGAPLSSPYL